MPYVLVPFTETDLARPTNILTRQTVRGLREPGMHADGNGLYVRIDQTLARRWVLIYFYRKKRREMGLGSLNDVELADARREAAKARAVLAEGLDPIEARRVAAVPASERAFSAVASDLMDQLEKRWKSPKSRPQWEASLKQHAPAVWKMDVAAVDTQAVLEALQKIWGEHHETASRVRSRIERVLDAAKARGLRSGENPARWKGHLSTLLAAAPKSKGHHAAMAYGDVPDFVKLLAGRSSVSAMALRFLILTGTRSGEVRGAVWSEIVGQTWRIPAERMKGGREHRVPLSEAALAVLARIPEDVRQGLVFPGWNGPLSDMTLGKVIRSNGITDATPHGFRSSFRDWAGDCTGYPRELIEEALAHQVGNAVERAYRRSDALEKRRGLMESWGSYCTGETGQIVQFPMKA